MNYFSTSIDELTEWFRNYQVESIEVWISSRIVESNGIAEVIIKIRILLIYGQLLYLYILFKLLCFTF